MPNWISTAGHEHGTMGLRWVLADALPEPRTRVAKPSELRARAGFECQRMERGGPRQADGRARLPA